MISPNRGFSLLELLVVIAIAGILLGVGIPSLREMLVNASRREASVGLYSALNRARSEAIARNDRIELCARDPSAAEPRCAESADWLQGWIVYQPGESGTIAVLSVHEPVSTALRFAEAPAGAIGFEASGRTTASIDFQLCAATEASDSRSRRIRVRRSGGISLEDAATCS